MTASRRSDIKGQHAGMNVTDHRHHDPIGAEWLPKNQAIAQAGGEPGPLPEWGKPEHVSGVVLGQYLYDPTENVVHHVMGSHPDCGIDALKPRVFLHFWEEVRQHYPQAQACGRCEW